MIPSDNMTARVRESPSMMKFFIMRPAFRPAPFRNRRLRKLNRDTAPHPNQVRSTATTEEHRHPSRTSEPNGVHSARTGSTLRDKQGSTQASNNLVPLDEGAAGRASRRREQRNQTTTRGKHGTKQTEIRPRVRLVEAARQDNHLRHTLLKSSAMSKCVGANGTAGDQHMLVGRQATDLLTEPSDGFGREPTTRPSEGETTTGKGRPKKGRTTNNKETTRTGNGKPENTRIHKKNHYSVFLLFLLAQE